MMTKDYLTKEELAKKARVAQCYHSLYFFVKEFWGEINAVDFITNWHVEYLCMELEKVARRRFKYHNAYPYYAEKLDASALPPKPYDLLINISPGASKSTIASQMYPAWCWLHDPSLRFITNSCSTTLVQEQSAKCKDVMMSAKFKEYFPQIKLKPEQSGKSHFKLLHTVSTDEGKTTNWVNGGERYTCSTGSSSIGQHADIILIDDPVKPQDVTGAVVEAANEFLKTALSTRMTDLKRTPMVMIMQRLHENDPSGMWLDEALRGKRKLKHICIPASVSKDINPPELIKYYENGCFFPARYDADILNDKEGELGAYGYAGQYMQSPVPVGNGMFKVSVLKDNIIDTIPTQDIVKSVRYWDKAGTAGGGDYTVGVLMHKMKDKSYIIADVIRGQWEIHKRERIIRTTAEKDGTGVTIWLEQEPGSGGKDSVSMTISNLAPYIAHAEKVTGEKEIRAEQYASQVNVGNVFMLRGLWNKDYLHEHEYFPNSKNDDQVDAGSGAFNRMFKAKKAGGWNVSRTK